MENIKNILDYAQYIFKNIAKVIHIVRGVVSDFPAFQSFEKFTSKTDRSDKVSNIADEIQELTSVHSSAGEARNE